MTEERLKIWIDVLKWLIGSVVLVIVTTIIDKGFKEREMVIKEMAKYDTYIDMVTSADKLVERRKLAQFFKTMTLNEDVQLRWSDYYDLVNKEYEDTLASRNAKLDTLNNYLSKPIKTEEDSQKIEEIQKDINNINYQITSNVTASNAFQLNKIKTASIFENEGYDALKKEDFSTAAEKFKAAETTYPTLHSNYEIGKLLTKSNEELQKAATQPEKEIIKKEAIQNILQNYNYKMPPDVKIELQKKIEP